MITNATITSLATPGPSTTGGDRGALTTQSVNVRCFASEPTQSQRISLSDRITTATAVLFVPGVAASALAINEIVGVQIDGGPLLSLVVIFIRNRQKPGGLSHLEVYAKESV